MIHKFNMKTRAQIKCEAAGWAMNCGINWKVALSKKIHQGLEQSHALFEHQGYGIRVSAIDGFAVQIEANLSDLFHGCSGIHIKNPSELGQAIAKLDAILDEILAERYPYSEFTYLELGLTIRANPDRLLAAHRHARHPLIRRETQQYSNRRRRAPHLFDSLNTVRLHGKNTTIQLYNKRAEVMGLRHRFVREPSLGTRVEVQLRGKPHIANQRAALGITDGSVGLRSLSMEGAYRFFRSIVIGLEPDRIPVDEPSMTTLLALCEQHNVRHPSGVSVMEWYRTTVKPITYQRKRQEVASASFRHEGWSWAALLPEDHLPEIVDVDAEGRETLDRTCYRLGS